MIVLPRRAARLHHGGGRYVGRDHVCSLGKLFDTVIRHAPRFLFGAVRPLPVAVIEASLGAGAIPLVCAA
jgi:hypothetical protein